MSQQTQRMWRRPPDPLGKLRDLGSVDVSIQVSVYAGRDEQQTPAVALTLTAPQFRTVERVLGRDGLRLRDLADVREVHADILASMQLDDCSHLAQLLDDDGRWSDTVTALRKALGLAGCWVELQAGP